LNEDRPHPGRDALVGLLLLALAFATYHAVWQAGFIWDDDGHVTRPDLRTLHGLGRIWLEPGATQQYYPLLHSAFWVEHRLWGDRPAPYHVLNIALHAGVGVLLYRLLRQLGLPGALLAAAAFTLHPVAVETVAWVSEQKNTLSGVLALGAALAYLRFDRGRRPGAYAAATILFALALATKTVTASLPAALLVLFWWQRGRITWKADVRPLLPWFGLAAAAGAMTAWVEHTYIGATGTAFRLSPVDRVLIAGRALWFYLGKILWPHPLIFMYPHWRIAANEAWQYAFPVAALGVLAMAFGLRGRTRGPLAATLLFAGTLFPALGFINVFPFIYSYVADHFQYLASAVVISAAAAAFTAAVRRLHEPARRVAGAAAVLAVGGLGLVSAHQARAYVDAETLWQDTLAKNPRCWMAYQNLGGVYLKADRPELAVPQFERALAINPNDTEALNELGVAELHAGRLEVAVGHLRRALALAPADPETHLNLGVALLQAGSPESTDEFARALELDPHSVGALKNLALAAERANHWPEAVGYFQRASGLEPGNAETRASLGAALLNTGDLPRAARELAASLALHDGTAPVHFNLGAVLAQEGKTDEAEAEFQRAVALDPQLEPALANLANARMRKGDAAAAVAYLERALAVDPANAPLRNNLGIALAKTGRLEAAAEAFQRALDADPGYEPARRNLAAARHELGRD
jgi:tetratricopeptide (TPR) repeat protein